MSTRTCVIRPYGQQNDYVPVDRAEGLVLGEKTFTGNFEPRSQTIPGPFSGGIASSRRTILVPVGELTEGTVSKESARTLGLPLVETPRLARYQYCSPCR